MGSRWLRRAAPLGLPLGLPIGLLLSCLAVASPAGAQDWLAHLPSCAYEEAGSRAGTLELIYPRAGMPAVVRSGGVLITRVKLRSALMPPPGRQQPRALRGWGAELVGRSLRSGLRGNEGSAEPEHRYPVRVSNVRPDGPTSLVFRAHIPIPVWVAPGTYDLRLRVPGGGREMRAASVRVIEGEAPIRVGWLGPPPAEEPPAEGAEPGTGAPKVRQDILRALAWHPEVEVWITDPAWLPALAEVPESEPLPALLALPEGGLPVVFFTGQRYLALGRCEGRYLPFDQAVEGIRALHPGPLSNLTRARLPGPGQIRIGEQVSPAPRVHALGVRRDREQLLVAVPALPAPLREARIDLLLPRTGHGYFLRGARASRFWPSVFVPPEGQAPGILVQVRARAEEAVRIRFRRDGGVPALEFSPSAHPRSGYPTTIRLRPGLPRGARVFWRYGVDENHLGPSLRHTFSRAGDHHLTIWAIDEHGASRQVAGRVRIAADLRDGGCSVTRPGSAPGEGAAAVWLLALLLGWRMRIRRGNSPA